MIGAITALFMGILGIIQNDIKRVIAYSTLSQLGYMTVALGASAYSVAVFHLMTHAFFKALLFLGAGSVIMGMHHNQDIRWMGGVRKYMPITWITFLLGNLALIGTPFFSGFYSKDAIIEAVHACATCRLPVLPTLPCWPGCSSRRSTRSVCTSSCSTAKERYDQNPDAHHGHAWHDDHGHGHDAKPHESPWVVTLPLVLLAIPSVVIGAIALMPMLFGDFFKGVIFVDRHQAPAPWPSWPQAIPRLGAYGPARFSSAALLAGFGRGCGVLCVLHGQARDSCGHHGVLQEDGLYQVLEGKYGVDWVYENIFARGARSSARCSGEAGDQAADRWCRGERLLEGGRQDSLLWSAGSSLAISTTTRWS